MKQNKSKYDISVVIPVYNIRWLERVKELAQFLRTPQRVFCVMRENHYKDRIGDPNFSISVVATGQIGSKHLFVISNRQTP